MHVFWYSKLRDNKSNSGNVKVVVGHSKGMKQELVNVVIKKQQYRYRYRFIVIQWLEDRGDNLKINNSLGSIS